MLPLYYSTLYQDDAGSGTVDGAACRRHTHTHTLAAEITSLAGGFLPARHPYTAQGHADQTYQRHIRHPQARTHRHLRLEGGRKTTNTHQRSTQGGGWESAMGRAIGKQSMNYILLLYYK